MKTTSEREKMTDYEEMQDELWNHKTARLAAEAAELADFLAQGNFSRAQAIDAISRIIAISDCLSGRTSLVSI